MICAEPSPAARGRTASGREARRARQAGGGRQDAGSRARQGGHGKRSAAELTQDRGAASSGAREAAGRSQPPRRSKRQASTGWDGHRTGRSKRQASIGWDGDRAERGKRQASTGGDGHRRGRGKQQPSTGWDGHRTGRSKQQPSTGWDGHRTGRSKQRPYNRGREPNGVTHRWEDARGEDCAARRLMLRWSRFQDEGAGPRRPGGRGRAPALPLACLSKGATNRVACLSKGATNRESHGRPGREASEHGGYALAARAGGAHSPRAANGRRPYLAD